MGEYTRKLERYRNQWRTRYDEIGSTAAFGDPQLLSLQRSIESIEHDLSTHEECENCDGWGVTECDECGHERDCEYCENGLIEK